MQVFYSNSFIDKSQLLSLVISVSHANILSSRDDDGKIYLLACDVSHLTKTLMD